MRLVITKYDKYLSVPGRRVRINFLSPWLSIDKIPLKDRFSLHSFCNEGIFQFSATNNGSLKIPFRVNPSPVMEDKGENGLSTGC
jgi:hypothetical protein